MLRKKPAVATANPWKGTRGKKTKPYRPRYADGGYPLWYFAQPDQVHCPWCAGKTDAPQVNWEDPELYCDECGDRIESAYAEK